MKPQKTKVSNKRTKKSPIVAVVVEHHGKTAKHTSPEPMSELNTPPQASPVPEDNPAQRKQTVKMIAETLGEPKEKRGQIYAIVKHLGCEASTALLKEAQEREANGGMLTKSGERRRTPGGVFFALVRANHPGVDFRPPRRKAGKLQSAASESRQVEQNK